MGEQESDQERSARRANAVDARLIREMFNEESSPGTEIVHVEGIGEAETLLAARTFDVILLDLRLTDAEGIAAVRKTHALAPRVPLVVLSILDDDALATQALHEGAQDYLVKGQIEERSLLRALRYAVERKMLDDALFAEQQRAQATLNSIGDAVICCDESGNVTFLNVVAEKMTGWSSGEAAGRPMAEVFRIVDATSRAPVANPMTAAIAVDRTMNLPLNCILLRRGGLEIPIEDSVAPTHDSAGRPTGAVIVFRDVTVALAIATAARVMAQHMSHAAQHDFLTGLPNRLFLTDRLAQAIAHAERYTTKLAVLFVDLDGFKEINNTLGHAVGDRLLQSIAQRLVDRVRGSDTVSRQGGDEFGAPERSAASRRGGDIGEKSPAGGSGGTHHRRARGSRYGQRRPKHLSG